MTISANDRRELFNGDNSTTTFSVNFPIDSAQGAADIEVTLINTTTLAESVQSSPSQFTVINLTTTGFEIVFTTAPTSGEKILILGRQTRAFGNDFTIGDSVVLTDIQDGYDKLEKQIQELAEQVNRCLRVNQFSTKSSITFPDPLAADDSKRLVWDNDTLAFIFAAAQTAGALSVTSFIETLLDDASATAAQTTLGLLIGTDIVAKSVYDAHIANEVLHPVHVIFDQKKTVINQATDSDTTFQDFNVGDFSVGGDIPRFAILGTRLKIAQETSATPNDRILRLRVRKNGSTEDSLLNIEHRLILESPIAGVSGDYNEQTVESSRQMIVELAALDGGAATTTEAYFEYDVEQFQPVAANIIQVFLEGYIT